MQQRPQLARSLSRASTDSPFYSAGTDGTGPSLSQTSSAGFRKGAPSTEGPAKNMARVTAVRPQATEIGTPHVSHNQRRNAAIGVIKMSDQDRTAMRPSTVLSRRTALLSALALPFIAPAAGHAAPPEDIDLSSIGRISYNATVLDDGPSAFWTMGHPLSGLEADISGHGHRGRYLGRPKAARLPNGETATVFNGSSQYMQVGDHPALSPATAGVLTLEAWMRPDTLHFPHTEGTGYVHWMGKGAPNNHEYAARMYSSGNSEDRANRISGYLFNASGGKGAGSYFQQEVHAGQWIHYVLVINANATSAKYPNGYTKIYRNGELAHQDNLDYRGTPVTPHHGNAPFRVGTRDFNSFFNGAIGKVAIYSKELPTRRIAQHYAAMTQI